MTSPHPLISSIEFSLAIFKDVQYVPSPPVALSAPTPHSAAPSTVITAQIQLVPHVDRAINSPIICVC